MFLFPYIPVIHVANIITSFMLQGSQVLNAGKSMLEVFPPFDVIKALHVLQLALLLSFLVKYNQTLERFCLDAMLETF